MQALIYVIIRKRRSASDDCLCLNLVIGGPQPVRSVGGEWGSGAAALGRAPRVRRSGAASITLNIFSPNALTIFLT